MKLVKCSNAHYYDAEKETSCPHCRDMDKVENPTIGIADIENDKTVTIDSFDSNDKVVTPKDIIRSVEVKSSKEVEITPPTSGASKGDDSKTIGVYDDIFPPVVGWLVCVEGSHYGEDFRLKVGGNFIGRSSMMDIALTNSMKVSREKHAVVIYEPKEAIFLVQPGESRELFYLNGKVVLQVEKLKNQDILEIGDLKLMLVPLCGESFRWENYKKD